jgi:hypothetical protein
MKKRIVLGLLLASSFNVAQASMLSIANPSGILSISGYNGQPASVTGVKQFIKTGSLVAITPGNISFTFLGQVGGYLDSFKFNDGSGTLTESNPLGTTITSAIDAGTVAVSFMDDVNRDGVVDDTFTNGTTETSAFGFGILMDQGSDGSFTYAQDATIPSGPNAGTQTFDYLLGFNDSFIATGSKPGDADYDDFVVGVNFVSSLTDPPLNDAPSPVPLPAAAWLFGSALMGFMSWSNRRNV